LCRKSGLEQKRRCGWKSPGKSGEGSEIVWGRGAIATTTCPTSYVTTESVALIEEFYAWKLCGAANVYDLPARLVEAIFVLENELRAETNDGQK